ncbi:MAG: hypothetical protein U1E22_01685 [Coriobacteriia bacterium]|nr:hypothetical protein [Coriobacteriia bacterium]
MSKLISGRAYYYLVESARVEGKPRIVSQQYLGPAEEVLARLSGSTPGEPGRSRHLAFGDIAAVWSVLSRLRVAEIVDEAAGPRRKDAAASVGTYVALCAANRVVAPCSKQMVGQDDRSPSGQGPRPRPRSPALLGRHGGLVP